MTDTQLIERASDATGRREYINPKQKAEMPEGPWQNEPDKVQWYDETTGMACLIVRGPVGALCGYVGVESNHSLYGKDYDSAGDISVHGGLTFAAPCQENHEGICHVPTAGRTDDVWWFGFDCAHAWDLIPHTLEYRKAVVAHLPSIDLDDVYRDVGYVTTEIESLAAQLKKLEI